MNNSDYKIVSAYGKNKFLVNVFNNFIAKVFPSISFKEWNERGFWSDKYIPFSIVKSDQIISNVSVSQMSILKNGEKYKSIQLGAVGTLPEYRDQGLSRSLMNYVIDKYESEIDFIMLFANESVLNFYPKFGFQSIQESIFISENNIPISKYSARKLNIKNESDYSLVVDLIENRKILTKIFGAEDYGFITMWHLLNIFYNDLYYLEDEEVLTIKTEERDTLNIFEVIHKKEFDFNDALLKIISSNSIRVIKFHFPPDQLEFRYDKAMNYKSDLFIRGKFEMKNREFKFPVTAQT